MGARAWFSLGPVAFQPADPAKLVLIALLAKYFSRRHTAIRNFRHIIVSGLYAAAPILLVLLEPDLGTAVIMMSIWFGMILVSGISKKHLAAVIALGLVAAAGLWFFGLHDYQRARIVAFVNPAADIRGSGYNAYQATIAVGSGELWGKGIGYGTQSKLRFLPVYQTDFIFAAFAEEWGFAGVGLVLLLYGLLLARLIAIARRSATNFDALFTIGVVILFVAHIFIHAGINVGLLPVTGTTIPFMSSGGSHLIMEFAALGIVASLAKSGRSAPREQGDREFVG
jgi:rod shape determining protein RodA